MLQHKLRRAQRLQQALMIRASLTHDIEGRTMIDGGSHKGNPHRCGYAGREVVHFDRDMPLIMIKRQHRIEFPSNRSVKN